MEFIPNIEAVRKQTANSGEEITQHWVEKLIKAISNGIWQEAKGGNRTYAYKFDSFHITYKNIAMSRVITLFQDAGYTVKASDVYYYFSW